MNASATIALGQKVRRQEGVGSDLLGQMSHSAYTGHRDIRQKFKIFCNPRIWVLAKVRPESRDKDDGHPVP